jgi:hypothetical protein
MQHKNATAKFLLCRIWEAVFVAMLLIGATASQSKPLVKKARSATGRTSTARSAGGVKQATRARTSSNSRARSATNSAKPAPKPQRATATVQAPAQTATATAAALETETPADTPAEAKIACPMGYVIERRMGKHYVQQDVECVMDSVKNASLRKAMPKDGIPDWIHPSRALIRVCRNGYQLSDSGTGCIKKGQTSYTVNQYELPVIDTGETVADYTETVETAADYTDEAAAEAGTAVEPAPETIAETPPATAAEAPSETAAPPASIPPNVSFVE